jgi:hypothetical protein
MNIQDTMRVAVRDVVEVKPSSKHDKLDLVLIHYCGDFRRESVRIHKVPRPDDPRGYAKPRSLVQRAGRLLASNDNRHIDPGEPAVRDALTDVLERATAAADQHAGSQARCRQSAH